MLPGSSQLLLDTGCHLVKSRLGAEKEETNDLVSDILEKVSGMLSCLGLDANTLSLLFYTTS